MTRRVLQGFIRQKFIRDVGLNGISTAIVAIAVLAINTLIGRYYGAEALGIYNASLSVYIIFSMISVLGTPHSILKRAAEVSDNREALSRVSSSGLLIGGGASLVFICGLYGALKWGFAVADSKILSAFMLMVPAVWFASINKCCRAVFNGIRDIKSCSLIELTRWLGILGFVCVAVFFERPMEFVFRGFLFVEVFLSLACLLHLVKYVDLFSGFKLKDFLSHFSFGLKSTLGSSLLVVNDRMAVLILAFLLSYREVGIFSFAFELSKGLLALTQVIQTNFNPIISKRSASNDFDGLANDIRRIRRVVSKLAGVIFIASLFCYPIYVIGFMNDVSFYDSIGVFYILLVGVSFALMYFWMGSILTMAGYPGDSFIRNLIFLICTVVFNFTLIPLFGIYGAAVATSATYFVRIYTLKVFVARRLEIQLD